ncbi:MAG: TAT-variant-translocated molybdopterin oxidoreductase, partial [Flavobacteriales bacterium]
MPSTKQYWMDAADLRQDPEALEARANEFPAEPSIDRLLGEGGLPATSANRRDFLKFLGFSLGAATLAACETPVVKSIPYVSKPEEITPGVANWYASTYYDGQDFASILVKTREGRPIHIKGNPRFGINRNPALNKGVAGARINSSVLTLYDGERLKGPRMRQDGKLAGASWSAADAAIAKGLAEASAAGKRIVVLTHTIISPSTKAAIAALKAKHASVQHVQYDTISYSGITNANLKCFGKRVFPGYDFSKADVVVSLDADFLSGWGSSNEYQWQYATRRDPDGAMGRHWQVEARMSLTGANADRRVMVSPAEVPLAVIALHDAIAAKAGMPKVGGGLGNEELEQAAQELWAAKGRALVVCGTNHEGTQVLVNSINAMLGSYGATIDLDNHTNFFQGDDAAMAQLVEDMNAGAIGALIIAGVNPAYSLPNAADFRAGLEKVGLTVSCARYADETASLCQWVCPDHHYLEAWCDHNPKPGQ